MAEELELNKANLKIISFQKKKKSSFLLQENDPRNQDKGRKPLGELVGCPTLSTE